MRSLSPDSASTYRSRGTESNFTSPVAGVTRTSIIVSERVDAPSAESGLRSTPRTSTSSGSPEACSASLDAACLAASCPAPLAASFLASRAPLRADWSLVSVVGSRLRDAARSFVVSWAGARVSSADLGSFGRFLSRLKGPIAGGLVPGLGGRLPAAGCCQILRCLVGRGAGLVRRDRAEISLREQSLECGRDETRGPGCLRRARGARPLSLEGSRLRPDTEKQTGQNEN